MKPGTKAIFALSAIIIIAFLSGCFGESADPVYTYSIQITGLGNFTNDNATEVLVPVPSIGDQPLFNTTGMQSNPAGWTIALEDTGSGKMLSLKTNRSSLSDIYFTYYDTIQVDRLFSSPSYATVNNSMMDAPLRPKSSGGPLYSVFQESPDTTRAAYYQPVKNYSSYVSIDKNIRPKAGDNNTITIKLGFSFYRGMSDSNSRGGTEWAGVYELIPQGATGNIPVNVTVWSSSI